MNPVFTLIYNNGIRVKDYLKSSDTKTYNSNNVFWQN